MSGRDAGGTPGCNVFADDPEQHGASHANRLRHGCGAVLWKKKNQETGRVGCVKASDLRLLGDPRIHLHCNRAVS